MAGELRALIDAQTVAALGTLHRGEPYVSMVPYALDAGAPAFVIHVSALAPHTKDMLAHPRVSLLIVAPDAQAMPQARARVTVQGDAAPVARDSPGYESARALYLARFPHAEGIFALADFTLFRIRPASLRWIAGFAQARSLVGEALVHALRGVPPAD